MGYILPIQQIQSTLYADRMRTQERRHHYAMTNRVPRVEMDTSFLDSWMASEKKHEQQQKAHTHTNPSNIRTPLPVHPNPLKLSPIIAKVVGKGIAINRYV